MTSIVNQGMIEGLVSIGLGQPPKISWEPCEMALRPVLAGLAEHRLVVPALDGSEGEKALFARTGLGLLVANVIGHSSPDVWPEKGLRRTASIAMELGSVASAIIQKFFFCERYVEEFIVAMRPAEVQSPTDGEQAQAREMSEEESMLLIFLWSALEGLNRLGLTEGSIHKCIAETLNNMGDHVYGSHMSQQLEAELPGCVNSSDFALLAEKLYPEGQDDSGSDGEPSDEKSADPSSAQPECGAGAQGTAVGAVDPQPSSSQPAGSAGTQETSAGAGDHQRNEDPSGAPAASNSEPASDDGTTTGQPAGAVDKDGLTPTEPSNSALQAEGLAPGNGPTEANAETQFGLAESTAEAADEAEAEADQCHAYLCFAGDALATNEGEPSGMQVVNNSQLVTTLMRVLQDKREHPVGHAMQGTRISASRMWRLRRLGDPRVFKKSVPLTGIDLSLQVLVDRSGSMKGTIREALESAFAIVDALRRISGTKVALSCFPGMSTYTREILPFGGALGDARAVLHGMTASGGTPLAAAMTQLLPSILNQRSDRKCLLVITDGEPADEDAAIAEVKRYELMGVEVLGIAIGQGLETKIRTIIPRSVGVDGVGDLHTGIERMFRSEMLQKA